MLEPRHIMHLKIDRSKLDLHRQMPSPAFASRPLMKEFATIGDFVIAQLLGVDAEEYAAQLPTAWDHHAAYVGCNEHNQPVGISAATSLIKHGSPIEKHMVIPRNFLRPNRKLAEHLMLSVFVRGQVTNGKLPDIGELEIAGWSSVTDIQKWHTEELPATFETKLSVVAMPCRLLQAISNLPKVYRPGVVVDTI